MDQNRNQPPINPNARGQQQSGQQWNGHERRLGMPDRRKSSQPHARNTTADTRMMNEGSSR